MLKEKSIEPKPYTGEWDKCYFDDAIVTINNLPSGNWREPKPMKEEQAYLNRLKGIWKE